MSSQLITIPRELLGEIITHVPLVDLIRLCQSDKYVANICNNDRLLSLVISEQTGYKEKPPEYNWKQFAILLARNEIKQIEVIYKNRNVGNVWLWPNKKLEQVINEILTYYPGNNSDLAIKFNFNIYVLIPEALYSRTINIDQYPSPNKSIWLNTEEIEIIDDPIIINQIVNMCRRCQSFNTISHQSQTRSADEPLMTYIQCIDCGSRMRF